jgi:chromosomal replication initiation ATPase DnaA
MGKLMKNLVRENEEKKSIDKIRKIIEEITENYSIDFSDTLEKRKFGKICRIRFIADFKVEEP